MSIISAQAEVQVSRFGCDNLASSIERNNCGRELSEIYSVLLKLNKYSIDHSSSTQQETNDQLKWENNVSETCQDAACYREAFANRMGELQKRSTLCTTEEVAVFSCFMPKKKQVSICARKDGQDLGYVQYRYGRSSSSIELEYPQSKDEAKKYFKSYSFSFAKGRTLAISFRNDSYRYSLFSTSSVYGYNGAGVITNKGPDNIRVSFIKCQGEEFEPTFGTAIPFYRLQEIFKIPDAGKDISFIKASAGATDDPDPDSKSYHPKPGEPENDFKY